MNRIILIGGFSVVAFVAWWVGGNVMPSTLSLLMGVLFGSFVGIPAMLIIASGAKTVRHDHYVHNVTETPVEPQKQPTALTVHPTRYIVIANRPAVPVGTQNKIEVGR